MIRTLSLVLLVVCGGALAQSVFDAPLPESSHSTTGYRSVAEAANALRARSGLETSLQNGSSIMVDEAALTIWSFAPKDDPSYPSVVKRIAVEKNGVTHMVMSVQCEASKAACDDLVKRFLEPQAATREAFEDRR